MKTIIRTSGLIVLFALGYFIYSFFDSRVSMIGTFITFSIAGFVYFSLILCRARKDIEYWSDKFNHPRPTDAELYAVLDAFADRQERNDEKFYEEAMIDAPGGVLVFDYWNDGTGYMQFENIMYSQNTTEAEFLLQNYASKI